jgi:large subunit ribosomal protein L29
MKIAEQRAQLRELTVDDLQQRIKELDDQVFRMRLQKSMGQTESANKMRPLRRELARIQTILREKSAGN